MRVRDVGLRHPETTAALPLGPRAGTERVLEAHEFVAFAKPAL